MKTLSTFFIMAISLVEIAYAQVRTNIVGGNNTTVNQQPWQVYIISNNPVGSSSCGGTIIGPNTVLTAAHCVSAYTANQVQVYAGTSLISQLATLFNSTL